MKIMKNLMKRIGVFTLALAVMLGLNPLNITQTASATAEVVTYLDEAGDGQTCSGYTSVSSASGDVIWSEGWYIVDNDATIDGRVTVNGHVHLILCDNETLTVKKGISVLDNDNDITTESTNSLTIYAQSTDSHMGKLYAGTTDGSDLTCTDYYAGIGGQFTGVPANDTCGTITINGGDIIAKGKDGGAGIGDRR